MANVRPFTAFEGLSHEEQDLIFHTIKKPERTKWAPVAVLVLSVALAAIVAGTLSATRFLPVVFQQKEFWIPMVSAGAFLSISSLVKLRLYRTGLNEWLQCYYQACTNRRADYDAVVAGQPRPDWNYGQTFSHPPDESPYYFW